jgi:hypothetical protein
MKKNILFKCKQEEVIMKGTEMQVNPKSVGSGHLKVNVLEYFLGFKNVLNKIKSKKMPSKHIDGIKLQKN